MAGFFATILILAAVGQTIALGSAWGMLNDPLLPALGWLPGLGDAGPSLAGVVEWQGAGAIVIYGALILWCAFAYLTVAGRKTGRFGMLLASAVPAGGVALYDIAPLDQFIRVATGFPFAAGASKGLWFAGYAFPAMLLVGSAGLIAALAGPAWRQRRRVPQPSDAR